MGPYKISKTNVGSCPNVLMLMAQCTLDQLDLKNTENLDFNFISFKGINSGKMITKINNKIIENNITTFASLQLRSFKESYFSRYKEWFREKIELDLGEKKFVYKKFKQNVKTKKYTKDLECEYVFDELTNKKILDQFHSDHPNK